MKSVEDDSHVYCHVNPVYAFIYHISLRPILISSFHLRRRLQGSLYPRVFRPADEILLPVSMVRVSLLQSRVSPWFSHFSGAGHSTV